MNIKDNITSSRKAISVSIATFVSFATILLCSPAWADVPDVPPIDYQSEQFGGFEFSQVTVLLLIILLALTAATAFYIRRHFAPSPLQDAAVNGDESATGETPSIQQ